MKAADNLRGDAIYGFVFLLLFCF